MNIAAFFTREGGRLRVSEPNAVIDEAEGHWTIEAELSCKPMSSIVGG
ncbi:hypothetical protein [Methanomassiliicoccus luminyensis]|jgi:putative transposase|nr:hypothetical protein [Methanomassiliicoccus luminyensis]